MSLQSPGCFQNHASIVVPANAGIHSPEYEDGFPRLALTKAWGGNESSTLDPDLGLAVGLQSSVMAYDTFYGIMEA